MTDDQQTVRVELVAADWNLKVNVVASTRPMRLLQLLPLANKVADAVTNMVEQAVEKQGRTISCKKGCAACCRTMVPISEVEARRVRQLVESFPEPKRSQVQARFAEALRRLDDAGLGDRLRNRTDWTSAEYKAVPDRYFLEGIACPFLEEESCSIYADRPMTCREYLVTSPPEKCALPTNDGVDEVKRPFRVMSALARFDSVSPTADHIRWVPLILSLEWAAGQSEAPATRTGIELARTLFQNVAEREDARLTIE